MAVRKLFWEDPYLDRADARVTSVDGDDVTLDRTVAYAFSGGQASDAGTIGGHEILAATTRGLDIPYTLPPGLGLSVGDEVDVAIDWDRRYRSCGCTSRPSSSSSWSTSSTEDPPRPAPTSRSPSPSWPGGW